MGDELFLAQSILHFLPLRRGREKHDNEGIAYRVVVGERGKG
jgi:hypothetical protein